MNIYLLIFGIYFAIMIATSLSSRKAVENMSDFAVGGNKMGLILSIGTFVATWLSVASVMGVPGNIYSRGVCAITGWIAGWFMATAIQPPLAYKIRRPIVPTRTFPEYLHLRYDAHAEKSSMQVVAAVIELLGCFAFASIQVQGFGIVVSSLTGLSYTVSCLAFLVVLLFTSFGGFQSVARTDTANAILILIGVITAAFAVIDKTGGFGPMIENFATTTAPLYVGGEPIEAGVLTSAWGTFGMSAIMSTFCANAFGASVAPHWIARFMAPKNAKTAALQAFWCIVCLIPIFGALAIIGIGGKMLMPSLPEGLSTDYMFPQLILNHLNPIIGGVALTAIAAAAVSTANSQLLHCSTAIIYDVKRALSKKTVETAEDDDKTTKELRYTIIALGALAVGAAILQLSLLADGVTYIWGAFGSVLFAPMWFGLFWKRMNKPACWASMVTGMAMYLYCTINGAPFGLPTFVVSAGCAMIVAAIVALCTKKPPVEAYEAYFTDEPSAETIAVIHKIRKDEV